MIFAEGAKRSDVRSVVDRAISEQTIRFTDHARLRLESRVYDHPHLDERDVFRILRKGKRDEDRDTWDHIRERWSYVFSGLSYDGFRMRVCVALGDPTVVVTIVLPGDPDAPS